MILFIKHDKTEGPGTLGDFFAESSWQVKTVELWNNEALPPADDCEAIISLGGPMNVYETDKYPFLQKEEILLKDAIRNEVPVLGICLGAQLLAKVAGAKIVKAPAKEIGWYEVCLTEDGKADTLFRGTKSPLSVFQWHQDSFDIPNSAALLATSDICKNQAFRFSRCAWGLQFHPEMTENMLETWLSHTKEKIDKDNIMLNYFKTKQVYDKQSGLMYLNFATAIARQEKIKA
ncbi:MAG: type 1 glutamine amidotransferase [Candidatus Omnitrophota bacterium]|jgi:GMP synthase-like glutamine amidotransferase